MAPPERSADSSRYLGTPCKQFVCAQKDITPQTWHYRQFLPCSVGANVHTSSIRADTMVFASSVSSTAVCMVSTSGRGWVYLW